MRKLLYLLLSLFLIALLLLSSCGSADPYAQQKNDMKAWLTDAKLDAQETPEQLYKAALQESTLVIYSVTTRVLDVKKSFEAQYPGLTVEVLDIRASDLIETLKENYRQRQYACDTAICTDSDTALSRDLIPNGLLYKYVPYDIADKLLPGHNTDQLEFLGEGEQIFYNTEVYDAPPVTNWWQLTEPRFKGHIYVANPLRSEQVLALFITMVQKSDEMALAYRDLYGKDLDIPQGSNAGKVFLQKLIGNGLQYTNSSDEVVEVVGTPGQTDPPLGIMISSKVRMQDIGYKIAPIFNVQPSAGIYAPKSIMIAGGAKNVNAAKLFIRWILGEAGGSGEGYKPYLQNGTWSARGDIKSQTTITLEQADFWRLDKAYIAKNKDDITSYWLSLNKP